MKFFFSNKIKTENEYFESIRDKRHTLTIKIQKLGILIDFISRTEDFIEILIYFVAGIGYINGHYSLGTLSLYILLNSKIFGIINDIYTTYDQLAQNEIDVALLHETIDNGKYIYGYDTGKEYIYSDGFVKLDHISYKYKNNDKYIFEDFSLDIIGGSKIALVGPSGGGKTTLMKLLSGYLYPSNGNIFIDNQVLPKDSESSDANHISLKSYYGHLGYLSQDPSVFDGSIIDNLLYGLSEKPEMFKSEYISDIYNGLSENDQKYFNLDVLEILAKYIYEGDSLTDMISFIKKCINDSRCEFVLEFTDGLLTQIGDKGVKLSGGQKQRLATAKIMIKNPNIIMLDEPTSALDSENEDLVNQALQKLFLGKTVIIIAHRLQTVKHCDQILYIKNGKITESGKHQELVSLKGKYHRMVELQSGF